MTERLRRDFECLGIDYNAFYPGETRLQALEILQSVTEVSEYQVFFYHSDHASTTLSTSLGSSSFITDANGDATQHLQYLPFGEDLVRSLSGVEGHEQNTAAYLSPYTFSGKERDVEMRSIREDLQEASTTEQTNLSYFGARYYESSLSVWLSVDPLADKQINLSPYHYCAGNPVVLKDPDGKLPLPVVTMIIGGVVGGISEGVSSFVSNKAQGMSTSQAFNSIDVADVIIASLEGAAIGAGAGPIVSKSVGALLKASIDVNAVDGTQTLGGIVGDKKDSKRFGLDLGSNLMGGALERTGIGKYLGDKLSKNKFLSKLIAGGSEGATVGGVDGGLKYYDSPPGPAGIVSCNRSDINPDGSIKPDAVVTATKDLPTIVVN